jgi:hypothetical protein
MGAGERLADAGAGTRRCGAVGAADGGAEGGGRSEDFVGGAARVRQTDGIDAGGAEGAGGVDSRAAAYRCDGVEAGGGGLVGAAGGAGRGGAGTVDPLGMVAKQDAWYLVARNAEGLRTYRVSRMREAVALAVEFERPREFNLAAWWAESTAALREKKRVYTVVFAMSAAAAAELAPWSPMRPVEDGARRLPEGWKVWEVEFDSAYAAKFVAMGMGARVVVLGPEELVREIGKEQRAAIRVQGSE